MASSEDKSKNNVGNIKMNGARAFRCKITFA
jgi:hypothetical protein